MLHNSVKSRLLDETKGKRGHEILKKKGGCDGGTGRKIVTNKMLKKKIQLKGNKATHAKKKTQASSKGPTDAKKRYPRGRSGKKRNFHVGHAAIEEGTYCTALGEDRKGLGGVRGFKRTGRSVKGVKLSFLGLAKRYSCTTITCIREGLFQEKREKDVHKSSTKKREEREYERGGGMKKGCH